MSDLDYGHILSSIRTIAHEAGQVILRYYHDQTEVMTKADGSPVTIADQAAEAVIVPALHYLTPDVPVVAEEAMAGGATPDLAGGRFWLVDPLDGTKEFISRNGEFTVNIALIEAGEVVLGTVYAPAIDTLYAGWIGHGAIRWDPRHGDRTIQVRSPPVDGLTVVASRSHGEGVRLDTFLSQFAVQNTIKHGSSLKFCSVACGEADLYPRFGPTYEWDTAAGHAVLQAAGGRVEHEDGGALRYNKPRLYNTGFIAYGWT